MKKWGKIQSKPEFVNRWIHIDKITFLKPEGDKVDYYINQGGDIVSILGVTLDGKIVGVKQYRPAVDEITIDIPGGSIEKNEKILKAAKREFAEETGLNIVRLKRLTEIYHDSGRSNQKKYIVFGVVPKLPNNIKAKLHDGCQIVLLNPNKVINNITANARKTYEPSLLIAVNLYMIKKSRV